MALGAALVSFTPSEGASKELPPLDLAGRPVDPFRATDSKVIVFVFVRTDCPISNRYAPEIQRLYDEFSPKGVMFWLVYPDPHESAATIRKHLREYGYRCRALRDPRHALVRMAKAQFTPEAAVFLSDRRMVYRGRIDDRYIDFGKARPMPTTHDLEGALQAALQGTSIANPATPVVGCYISDLR